MAMENMGLNMANIRKQVTKKGKTSVRTAHSLNPVPFIIYDKDTKWEIKDGAYGLANVAPTVVKMMGLTAPDCWEESMV